MAPLGVDKVRAASRLAPLRLAPHVTDLTGGDVSAHHQLRGEERSFQYLLAVLDVCGEEAVHPVVHLDAAVEGGESSRHVKVVYPEVRVEGGPGQDPGHCREGRHVGPASTVGGVLSPRPLCAADKPLAVRVSYRSDFLQDVAEEPELSGGREEGVEVARELERVDELVVVSLENVVGSLAVLCQPAVAQQVLVSEVPVAV